MDGDSSLPPISLLSLDLSGNVLTEFPFATLVAQSSLKKLDLSRNKIKNIMIPDNHDLTYKVFKSLKMLDLSSNNLTEFPSVLKECPRLETLRLIFNKITVIPQEFLSADNVRKNLVELNINSNPLKEIPVGIGILQHLKVLGISYTDVEEIPKSLVQINGFEQIYCFGTNLKKP